MELQHPFSAAVRTSTITMNSSTFAKASRGRLPLQFASKRTVYNARRPQKLFPADVRLKVSEAGTATVVDRRRGHFPRQQQDKERNHSSGMQYPKRSPRIGLAQNLRRLASRLEKESDHCLRASLRDVEVSVKELRDLVRRAEQRALTIGFYGHPPRVIME